jgi:prepilin-type N-terminal cleavage/methylation domain-containing protein/prepilin-type processing-associated H-X9-DG protein
MLHRRLQRGFTLVELMVVVGLVSMLVSLMLPVLGKMRAAAQATVCTSNLRVMGQAWAMYHTESRGKLMTYVWHTPAAPDSAWSGYWTGIVENRGGVRGNALLCPTASEISSNGATRGYGNATTAWTGRFQSTATGICFNSSTYRNSSYGYNRNLTADNWFRPQRPVTSLTSIKNLPDVPMFFDCAFADVRPENELNGGPVQPPPDLQGKTLRPGQPAHWNVLLARHGRGVNVCMADGHVKWVQLEQIYQMTWHHGWRKYRLPLPVR